MFRRMIVPVTACAALLATTLLSGCKETALSDIQDRPAKLGGPESTAAAPETQTRTDHFAASARRVLIHPALGPYTPEQIKRRAAELVEPPRLAAPPPSVLAKIPPHAFESSEPPQVPQAGETAASLISINAAPQRSSPRNVVIPMVVSSAGGGNWRAANADGSSAGNQSRNAHCREEALDQLKRYSASGYNIYERLDDKRMFTTWILCDERQRGLTTAVHEAVHMLTEQLDAYPLVDGGQIARIPLTEKFVKPGRIAAQFKQSDEFVRTYLMPGGASSADDFTYLIDEFNSYIHDLNTAVQTQAMAPKDSYLGHRDGMSAMMAFLMAYVALAEKDDPRTWAGLYRADVKHLVTTLWSDGERTIEKSCKVPRYAVDDQAFLRHICAPANGRALGQLLGRAPRCPKACLSNG